MTTPISFTSTAPLSWDGEGRRVSGGPLVPDVKLPEGEDTFSFSDLLSVFNPLQHIPVVSSLYRWVTGDTIKPAARVVGGALYGGPIGVASAIFNAIVEQAKGADIGALTLAMFDGDKAADEPRAAAAGESAAAPAQQAADAPVSTGADALAQLAADLRASQHGAPKPEPATDKTAVAVPAPAIAPAQGQGRDIAYYLANAGRRIPPTDLAKGRTAQAQSMPPTIQAQAAVAVQLADERKADAGPAAPDGPPEQWFNAAMMRGLDRYRAMQRGEASPQVDLSQ